MLMGMGGGRMPGEMMGCGGASPHVVQLCLITDKVANRR